jgi:phenylpropionate dioxygenase-like ring-hydroxylating dioxygenase large terminal subunit
MMLTFKSAERAPAPVAAPLRRFANRDVVCEGWYAVGAAGALRRGGVTRASIGNRDLVIYRDLSGVLRAAERACPHLGADLGMAKVVGKGLQCAFHRWCWGPDG